MKKAIVLLAVIFLPRAAFGSEPQPPSPAAFGFVGFSHFKEMAAGQEPAVQGAPQDRIDKPYLLPDCGKSTLINLAENVRQCEEMVILWRGILVSAGIRIYRPVFESGLCVIGYNARGSGVRDFFADPRQFKPEDETSLRENMAMVAGEMEKAGLKILASYVVNIKDKPPTYSHYYLTRAGEYAEQEIQVRALGHDKDFDFDILEGAGIRIIQKPTPGMTVYIGKEVGFVRYDAKTMGEAQQKLREATESLTDQGKAIIGSRIAALTENPEMGYRIRVYFYQ